MISRDSPLLRLPVDLEPRTRAYLDGIRYSAEMLFLAEERLREGLGVVSSGVRPSGFGPLFADAWSVVDSANRLRILVAGLPRIGKSRFETKSLISALRPAKELRNSVQHPDREINRMASAASYLPVVGAIGWVVAQSPATLHSFLAVAGSGTALQERLVNRLGRTFEPPLDLVTLQAHNNMIELSEVRRQLMSWLDVFEPQLIAELGVDRPTVRDPLAVLEIGTDADPTEWGSE